MKIQFLDNNLTINIPLQGVEAATGTISPTSSHLIILLIRLGKDDSLLLLPIRPEEMLLNRPTPGLHPMCKPTVVSMETRLPRLLAKYKALLPAFLMGLA